MNFTAKARILFDKSLQGTDNLVCGANEAEYHYTGFNPERDLPEDTVYLDLSKTQDGFELPRLP